MQIPQNLINRGKKQTLQLQPKRILSIVQNFLRPAWKEIRMNSRTYHWIPKMPPHLDVMTQWNCQPFNEFDFNRKIQISHDDTPISPNNWLATNCQFISTNKVVCRDAGITLTPLQCKEWLDYKDSMIKIKYIWNHEANMIGFDTDMTSDSLCLNESKVVAMILRSKIGPNYYYV